VLATNIDDGEKMVARYDLVSERAPNGEIHVRIEKFSVVEMDGVDLNDPAQRAELEPVLAASSAIPTMRIGANGQVVGFIGMDEMIEATLEMMKKIDGVTEDDPKFVSAAKRLRSPAGKAVVTAQSEELWRTWVGLWAGLELAPGKRREGTTRLPMSDGTTVNAPITLQHHGAVAPGLVRLTATTVFEGSDARGAMARILATQEAPPGQPPFDPKMLKSVKREIAIDSTTSPTTLMPKTVRVEKVIAVEMTNKQDDRRRHEIREYQFDWEPAASATMPK
jgi:hypothetical protein